MEHSNKLKLITSISFSLSLSIDIYIIIFTYNPIQVIHKKITDDYKKLVVKTKFSLGEDSRLLSAPLPIMMFGSRSSLNSCSLSQILFYHRYQMYLSARLICYDLPPCCESNSALDDVLQGVLLFEKGVPDSPSTLF